MFDFQHWSSWIFIEIPGLPLKFLVFHWNSWTFIEILGLSLKFVDLHNCNYWIFMENCEISSLKFVDFHHWNSWIFIIEIPEFSLKFMHFHWFCGFPLNSMYILASVPISAERVYGVPYVGEYSYQLSCATYWLADWVSHLLADGMSSLFSLLGPWRHKSRLALPGQDQTCLSRSEILKIT